MKTPFLVGKELYLRPLEREDAPTLGVFINDPDVRHTLDSVFPKNQEHENEWILKLAISASDVAMGIALRANDRLIGVTGLHQIRWKDRVATFGISIGAKDCWGQGYGTEATRLIVGYGFDTLGLNRVGLRVYDYNPRAIRCYEKAGFRREGLLRQDCYRDGKFWDVWVMGMIREDWDRAKGESL